MGRIPHRWLATGLLGLSLLLGPSTAGAAVDQPVIHGVPAARLRVPSIGVDAPVVELGIKMDGSMESPDGPSAVGWYTFSPTPGNPGNTVFSGHRDWRTGATGVFWRLADLSPGDAVSVRLADGQVVDYTVVLSVSMAPDQMDILEVVGPTTDETITLITCEGSFDPASRDYDKRRVVWATRAP
jgi:LPXTG-site transpeptidase (sortase) family protein